MSSACLHCVNDEEPFTVECDVSDLAMGATLNQNGRQVALMSCPLTKSERLYSAIEKGATAIIEAVRKWGLFLHARAFTLVTDQHSIAFMLDQPKKGKTKNAKIQYWCFELGTFEYTVHHRPGWNNYAADLFSRICSSLTSASSNKNLYYIYKTLGHPGIKRLWHFIRSKNLPYLLSDIGLGISYFRSKVIVFSKKRSSQLTNTNDSNTRCRRRVCCNHRVKFFYFVFDMPSTSCCYYK